jgi:hypothetical protein
MLCVPKALAALAAAVSIKITAADRRKRSS